MTAPTAMLKLPPLRIREWLNLPGFNSTASVFVDFEGHSFDGTRGEAYWGTSVTITDCNRAVTLDIEGAAASCRNSIHKVTTLIKALEAVLAMLKVAETHYVFTGKLPAKKKAPVKK